MLTGRRLCVCVELETHFIFQQSTRVTRRYQAPLPKSIRARERVTFGIHCEVIVQLSIRMAVALEAKILRFQPNFGKQKASFLSFTTATTLAMPWDTHLNYTHRALSTGIWYSVSTPSITDLDEKWKNRDFSPRSDKTHLKSSVCESHEVRYSTDTTVVFRLLFVVSLSRETGPQGTGLLSIGELVIYNL